MSKKNIDYKYSTAYEEYDELNHIYEHKIHKDKNVVTLENIKNYLCGKNISNKDQLQPIENFVVGAKFTLGLENSLCLECKKKHIDQRYSK